MLELSMLRTGLQARVDEINATMDDPQMEIMVRMLQSTRARALMDVIECIDQVTSKPCPTAEKLRREREVERSWQGHVDRQGGSFAPEEIAESRGWR